MTDSSPADAMTPYSVGMHDPVYTPTLLVHGLDHSPDREVLVLEDGTPVSAGEMRELISQYMQALAELQLPAGTRVGLLSKNRPEVLHVSNALILSRLCLVPLHPMGSIDDFDYVINDAQISCLIFDPRYFAEQATVLAERCKGLTHLVSLGSCSFASDLCALAASKLPRRLEAPEVEPTEIARLAYSGGTTGEPKGIMISHRSMVSALNIQLAEWEWPRDTRALICAPLSHSGSALFMPVLLRSGTLVVIEGFEPVAVMQAIERHRITCILLVPTMIYALLDHPRIDEFDLSSLETIFYGASLISPERLKQGIAKFGPIFFQFYGQSEAPMTVTVLRKAEHDLSCPERLASCGRPVGWVHCTLLDDEGQQVHDGTPGEICVRGPLVMEGYFGKPEQTREVFQGGWLHTGDVAIRSPDGFLQIVDRKKDMIITGGFNVYPREVEQVLLAHPAVKDAAVVGVPDPKWGEAVRALVVLHKDRAAESGELISLVREKKGPVQAPKVIHFVDAIPLSPLGKPDKKAIRVALANELSEPTAS